MSSATTITAANHPGFVEGLNWEREDTHFPDRMSRWGNELFCNRQSAGIGMLCTRHGFLFDEVRMMELDGWVYASVIPAGGKPRPAPPKFLVPLLVRIVPDLRKRIAIMRKDDANGYWGKVIEGWLSGGEQQLLDEGLGHLSTDLSTLSDTELADATQVAWAYADKAVTEHFHLHGAGINEIMRLSMVLNREHGFTTADLSGLLTGLSDTTTGPAGAQNAIVELIRAADAVGTLTGATSLDQVRAISPEIDAAIDDYMDTWGRRAIRYEIAYPTIAEQPGWVLDLLKAQLGRRTAADLAEAHAATRAEVEQRVLDALGDTPATRDRIARARRAFPVREGNETATVGIPAAVMRKFGQEAGRRLAAAGVLDDAAHVFDLEPAEVDAALRGSPRTDAAAVAAERFAARNAPVDAAPPRTIGPEPDLPDLSGFPDDIKEMVEAVLWFSSKASTIDTGISDVDDIVTDEAAAADVAGQGVAPGVYEGPARIVMGEAEFDRIEPGDVLVCPITSPVWSMVFPSLGALVCDGGGPLSHPAIIAREFGIPAVVDTGNATTTLTDGQMIRVDGGTGAIVVVG